MKFKKCRTHPGSAFYFRRREEEKSDSFTYYCPELKDYRMISLEFCLKLVYNIK